MVEFTLGVSFCLAFGSLVVAVTNFFLAPRLRQYQQHSVSKPKVSLLIPARNEAQNLQRLLPRLLSSDYENFEILVLDDHSTDGTADTVKQFNIPCIIGEPLPPQWTGKNWACWQLSRLAQGEILLFIDADVLPSTSALRLSVNCMESQKLDGLSCFARQIYDTSLLSAVVPFVMELPITGWIPIGAIRNRRFASLIAANGQWLAFRRRAYDSIGGHAKVRSRVLEDMALGANVKAYGAFQSFLAMDDISVRMYRTLREMLDGFSKNCFQLFGGHFVAFSLFFLFFLTLYLVPWLALGTEFWPLAVSTLAMTLLWRVLSASIFKSSPNSLLLHPLGMIIAGYLFLLSAKRHYFGGNSWKERALPLSS